MADHIFEAAETATAFRLASTWWRSLVGSIDDERWHDHALGEWTVRELVAHGDRAYRTVLEYVEGEAKDPTEIYSAASYFRTVLAEQTPHVHISARAKREADLEPDWVAATDQLGDAAERLVAARSGDTPVHTFVGEMLLDQYLATRVVELVVHGLDLGDALGLATPAPPLAARVAITVLLDLATTDDLSTVARSLTGRGAGFSIWNVLS